MSSYPSCRQKAEPRFHLRYRVDDPGQLLLAPVWVVPNMSEYFQKKQALRGDSEALPVIAWVPRQQLYEDLLSRRCQVQK